MTKKKKKKKKGMIKIDGMTFPTRPEEPKKNIEDFITWLYGPPKIGKSDLCSQLVDPLFLKTEPGLKFLKVKKKTIKDWGMFRKAITILEKHLGKKIEAKVIVIDTVDNLYKFCADYVAIKKGFEHPSDEKWGKGWEAIFNEWHKWIVRLCNLGVGVVFISHSTEKEVVSRSISITKTMPSIPNTAHKSLNAISDFIFYMGFKTTKKKGKKAKERRVIYTRPSETMEAGSRKKNLPRIIPCDDFETFLDYFYES